MFNTLKERHEERLKKAKKILTFDSLKNLKIAYIPYNELFKEGIMAGIGWAIGATIGFFIISTFLVVILRQLGGLPLVGKWIATIVDVTQQQLLKRTPIIPQ